MEDVLTLYTLPYDPWYPQVCFDETSKQLLAEVRPPQPAVPGRVAREDYEYEREGVRNLFLFFEPLRGWRHLCVTERRTKVDFAECMRLLVDELYPDAHQIRLVMDQLNTHKLSALYEVFAPAEAKRIIDRIDLHYTPKHGSWLNMAEIEFSVLSRQCLKQRIPDEATLVTTVAAWQAARNRCPTPVDWRFTTQDARIKLRRLYPSYYL